MKRRRKNMSDAAVMALALTGVVLVPVALAGIGVYAITRVAKRARDDAEIDEGSTRDEIDQGTTTGGGMWTSRIWNTNGVAESEPGWCFSFQSTMPNKVAKSPSCSLTYDQALAEVAKLRASVSGINEFGVL